MRSPRIPFLVPLAVGAALLALVTFAFQRDIDSARARWRLRVGAESKEVEERLFDVFHGVYQGLRTIARLPGVRALERHAGNLDANARQTIQEIYNNLATDVAMSEVYIVPLDLDPDAIDPVTGEPQEPIVTFDELILGQHADATAGLEPAGEADEPEEVEIHEYRLMREQLARFRELCPTEADVHGLDYPALTGREVVTCDNRYYSVRNPDDRDRMGIIYSVPVFGTDGALRGCVSGVLLTRALREVLPHGYYALRHAGNDYTAGSIDAGIWQQHLAEIERGVPAAELYYSAVESLRIVDSESDWVLWSARPDEEFTGSADAAQAYWMLAVSLFGVAFLVVAMGLRERTIARRRAEQGQRTRELQRARDAAENLSRARSNLIAVTSHEIRTPLDGIAAMADQLLRSELQPVQRLVVENARHASRTLVDLLQGILDYSAIEAGEVVAQRAEFDLHDLCEAVLQLMAPVVANRPIELTLVFGEDLPPRLVGDASMLRQVLTNLVGNAVKFTNQGAITVRVDWFDTRSQPLLCVRVSDTGVGLDPRVRELLFEPFTQGDGVGKRHGGVGLGLAISKGLVQRMGGWIEPLPTPAGGTTLAVTVPVDLPTIRAVPPRPLADRRIVVAMAKAHFAAMAANDLAALGADVVVLESADAAAGWLQQDRPVDLLLIEADPDWATDVLATIAAVRADLGVVLAEGWDHPIVDRTELPACVREIVRLPLGRSRLGAAMVRALQCGSRPTPAAAPVAVRPAAVEVRSASARPPVAAGPQRPPVAEPVREALPRVLVVDAQDAGLLVLSATLRRVGFDPVGASNLAKAVETAGRGAFAAVVVDDRLAGGLAAAGAALRPAVATFGGAGVRFVAIVGAADGGVPAGFDEVLVRPVGRLALAAALPPVAVPR